MIERSRAPESDGFGGSADSVVALPSSARERSAPTSSVYRTTGASAAAATASSSWRCGPPPPKRSSSGRSFASVVGPVSTERATRPTPGR